MTRKQNRFSGLVFAIIAFMVVLPWLVFGGTIVAIVATVTQVPGAPVSDAILPAQNAGLMEDDPAWDCRTMGNQSCGVEIEGVWYVLDFETGTFNLR